MSAKKNTNKKGILTVIVALFAIGLIGGAFSGSYNKSPSSVIESSERTLSENDTKNINSYAAFHTGSETQTFSLDETTTENKSIPGFDTVPPSASDAPTSADYEEKGRSDYETVSIVNQETSKESHPETSSIPKKSEITVTSGLTFRRNEYATISINAEPNTVYSISVYYNSGASKADGLESKTSDGAGNVSWTWKIGGKTAPGTYKVVISGNGEKITKEFTVIT